MSTSTSTIFASSDSRDQRQVPNVLVFPASERQPASRRFFLPKPAASALSLTKVALSN